MAASEELKSLLMKVKSESEGFSSAPWETFMQFRKQQSELDMEQQTGFK